VAINKYISKYDINTKKQNIVFKQSQNPLFDHNRIALT